MMSVRIGGSGGEKERKRVSDDMEVDDKASMKKHNIPKKGNCGDDACGQK
jgi:hypothetical protein